MKDYGSFPAAMGLRGILVTAQKRGHCDAKIKRLEAGSFEVPGTTESGGVELRPAQLAMILSGIDLQSARQRKRFQRAG